MTVRFAACLAALTLLGGCVEEALVCGEGMVRNADGMCVDDPVDSGRNDAGRDATVPPDASPCDPACTGGEVCVEIDEGTFSCVQCGGNEDCGAPTPVCDTITHTCVGCVQHGDCDPSTPLCVANTCAPCSEGEAGGCAERDATTSVCASDGACIECNLADSSACTGGETCDLFARSCVGVGLGDQTTCEPCTNDLQCAADHRCIRLEYAGAPRETGHCLRRETAGCSNPYRVIINRQSVSMAAAENYCGIDEDRATCEAVLALIADASCTVDGTCIIEGTPVPVPGAICERVAGSDDKCTYACSGLPAHCPGGLSCAGSPTMYCGGV